LKIFSNGSHGYEGKEISKPNRSEFNGGGKALIFSSDELHPYASADLNKQQYQFFQCVKKDVMQSLNLNEGDVLCNMPLNILVPKLTLKFMKEVANLHDMYMLSKILQKNAQILLENHKCETCPDLLTVFKPYTAASNADYQQTWYQKNKEKHAEYDKQCTSKVEYQESHKRSSQKHYQSQKDVKFPPAPPFAELCQNIVSNFCTDTSPDVFEETGCAVCGKLTPICEMEEHSEVENISLLITLTVKFRTNIWLHIQRKVLQLLWTIIHQIQMKTQSPQLYMIRKRKMAQQN
jgi:hypothetical protein